MLLSIKIYINHLTTRLCLMTSIFQGRGRSSVAGCQSAARAFDRR